MSNLHAALDDYVARGWELVRIKEFDKVPSSGNRWPTSTPAPQNFMSTQNVGVKLGPLSGNLIDLDLDHPAAQAVASLPDLFGSFPAFGRDNIAHPGHRIMVCPDLSEDNAKRHVFAPAKLAFVDIRAGGCQTVFPPSQYHEAKIVWQGGKLGPVPEIEWEDLKRRAWLVAFLAVCLDKYPVQGSRDDFIMHVGGALAHRDVEPELGERLIRGLCQLAGDEEEDMRATKCQQAWARKEAGEPTTGATRLREDFFGEVIAKALGKYLYNAAHDPVASDAIDLSEPNLSAFVKAIEARVQEKMPGAVFRRSGELSRVRVVETVETECIGRDGIAGVTVFPGSVELAPVTPTWLGFKLSEAGLQFFKMTGGAKPVRKVCWPEKLDTFIDCAEETSLPHILGVSATPTLWRDEPGYDPTSKLFLEFNGAKFPAAVEQPTKDDAAAARDRLLRPVRQFPFDGAHSKPVFLSAILSGVIRQEMSTCPLHAFDAPVAGTGKTMLAEIVARITTGGHAPSITFTPDDAEMEKRLGAILLRGGAMVNLDNCTATMSGDFLCSMLTAVTIHVRRLGESKVLDLDTRLLVCATGNNLLAKGDLVRRMVKCRINAGREDPDKREFKFDPLAEVDRARPQMVRDALTVLQSYIAAGRPTDPPDLGSFPDWTLIRGALKWLDMADPVASQDEARENDEYRAARSELLTVLREQFQRRTFMVRDIAALHDGHAVKAALEAISGNRELNPVRIGRALGRVKDIPTGPLTLLAHKDTEANVQGYQVHRKNDGLV